ncbi:hypothetical protein DID88_006856 [Monilinia fructigena]|uniref:G-patch domain-containing protein n=1 Tax=Monilinia fructigena TaxID=38457 RepID=A0A395IGR6_9HELO|nr:hypothetical protein DID88_006856 [Monilinia fructigena]
MRQAVVAHFTNNHSMSNPPNSTPARGPVVFKTAAASVEDEASTKKPQIDAATLRFQPTRRPQLPSQKPKAKAPFPKATPANANITELNNAPVTKAPPSNAAKPASKNTLADWAADDDDVNGFYVGEKRQRGGRKRRKKNKEEHAIAQDWDDIYDPSRPNNYEEYKNSDEKVREVRDGRTDFYAHRIAQKTSSDSDDEESYRPKIDQFAPPSNYSFAPPPIDSPPKRRSKSPESDSYRAISRAPVRYNLPPAPNDIPASEAELNQALADELEDEAEAEADGDGDGDAPKSLRPGQKGFAERLMSKYGWSKGSGLGADGSVWTSERVYIDRQSAPAKVFVKFTNQLSALRAVNALEGRGEVSQPPRQKVIVLWDLDNKPPSDLFSPYEAAQNLRAFASRFGNVIKIAAFANERGMSFVPSSILESRKDLQKYYELEKEMHKKHKVVPDTPYICGVCGAKKKTHADLEKHFKMLHERERNKKLNRASSMKGAKRKKFLANAFPEEKVVRYREAATGVITPADQYKLDSELRRAGVTVNLVKSGSQAADQALMTFAETMWKKKGGSYDWLILLSDDADFEPMLTMLH